MRAVLLFDGAPSAAAAPKGGASGAAARADDAGCGGPCSRDEQRKWAALCAARRPLVAGLGLVVLQQVTGQPTVLYYAQTIFNSAGMSTSAAKYSDLIVGCSKLVATLCSVPLVDRLGRRPLLFMGIAIMAVALLLLTLGFGVGSSGEGHTMDAGWSQVVVVALLDISGSPPAPFPAHHPVVPRGRWSSSRSSRTLRATSWASAPSRGCSSASSFPSIRARGPLA